MQIQDWAVLKLGWAGVKRAAPRQGRQYVAVRKRAVPKLGRHG